MAADAGEYVFFPTIVKCVQATNILKMFLVCVSLTTDIILACPRQGCHKATSLAMCLGWLAEGLMEVFMHMSQLAGNNLHVMNGPRRQRTCWAAPWRSSPPPSSSTRPRAPCPEAAPSARLLTRMAQQMQVLHRPHLQTDSFLFIPYRPPSLCHSHCVFHTHAHMCTPLLIT